MNKQIALSIEQMQKLQEFSLDCSGASMCHYKVIYSLFFGEKILEEWFIDFMNEEHYPSNFKEIDDIDGIDISKVEEIVPAFCLQDILELLSKVEYDCMGFPMFMMVYNQSFIRWEVLFRNPSFTNPNIYSENPLDAAYQMLCWCIENSYIKTK